MRSVWKVKQEGEGKASEVSPRRRVHLERQIKVHQGQNSGDRGGERSGLRGESWVQGERSVK